MDYKNPGERRRAAGWNPPESDRARRRREANKRNATARNIKGLFRELIQQDMPGAQTLELFRPTSGLLKPFVNQDRIYSHRDVVGPKGQGFYYVTKTVLGWHVSGGKNTTSYSPTLGDMPSTDDTFVLPNGQALRPVPISDGEGFSADVRRAQSIYRNNEYDLGAIEWVLNKALLDKEKS